jgi:hypothetical protein
LKLNGFDWDKKEECTIVFSFDGESVDMPAGIELVVVILLDMRNFLFFRVGKKISIGGGFPKMMIGY